MSTVKNFINQKGKNQDIGFDLLNDSIDDIMSVIKQKEKVFIRAKKLKKPAKQTASS